MWPKKVNLESFFIVHHSMERRSGLAVTYESLFHMHSETSIAFFGFGYHWNQNSELAVGTKSYLVYPLSH